ncbi:MAG: hypothetical protein GEU90_19790 [Gemmatimonas sp.]|nr:hypothetical protein [Gemmatimonas sp.]
MPLSGWAVPQLDTLADHSGPVVGVAAYAPTPLKVGVGEYARNERVVLVSDDYFQVLGSPLHLGQPIGSEHGTPGSAARVAVISYQYWQRALGRDRAVRGRLVWVAGVPLTVIGVTRPGFVGDASDAPAVWIPLTMAPNLGHNESRTTSPLIS